MSLFNKNYDSPEEIDPSIIIINMISYVFYSYMKLKFKWKWKEIINDEFVVSDYNDVMLSRHYYLFNFFTILIE